MTLSDKEIDVADRGIGQGIQVARQGAAIMNNHDQYPHALSNWVKSMGVGVAVCLLVGVMLSVGLRFFFPALVDEKSTSSNFLGITVWLVSIGLGLWQTAKHRPRRS